MSGGNRQNLAFALPSRFNWSEMFLLLQQPAVVDQIRQLVVHLPLISRTWGDANMGTLRRLATAFVAGLLLLTGGCASIEEPSSPYPSVEVITGKPIAQVEPHLQHPLNRFGQLPCRKLTLEEAKTTVIDWTGWGSFPTPRFQCDVDGKFYEYLRSQTGVIIYVRSTTSTFEVISDYAFKRFMTYLRYYDPEYGHGPIETMTTEIGVVKYSTYSNFHDTTCVPFVININSGGSNESATSEWLGGTYCYDGIGYSSIHPDKGLYHIKKLRLRK